MMISLLYALVQCVILFYPRTEAFFGFVSSLSHRRRTHLHALDSNEVNQRMLEALANLREKDKLSRSLSPEELSIVFEDDHIIVIDKPNGVLSVPSYPDTPSLAKTVHEYLKPNLKLEQLAVHRLGMDTSGLIVMGKTMENIRTLHEMFRTRKVTRQYTALVCGHVLNDEGLLSMQLMRDYEYPPYMRVSTKEHQAALLGLDPEVVGKKILQAPKTALTHYVVEQREQIDNDPDLPVTRLRLTSISGRTHQLNVHLAAFGFPIVQDRVYGFDGKAAPFGGLDLPQCKLDPAVVEAVFAATADRNMCIHASLIRLRHPQEKTVVEFTSTPPF